MKARLLLAGLCEAGLLADIDRYFAHLMTDLGAPDDVALLAALASAWHRSGHTCLALKDCAGRRYVDILGGLSGAEQQSDGADVAPEVGVARLPAQRILASSLTRSDLVASDGSNEPRPLIFAGGLLYLRRMFEAECALAKRMKMLADVETLPTAGVEATLIRLFDASQDEALAAARKITQGRLCIVTGGPGTGKTTLAARLIAVLLDRKLANPRAIALGTPTGKAAARLQESVTSQLEELAARVPAVRDFKPQAMTIHRLLNSDQRRRLDALVVDECSMVDLMLMARLLAELPERARLILLGDASQLDSVQPGRVFRDLSSGEDSAVHRCVVRLTKSHRFDPRGGIGRVATAVVTNDQNGVVAALTDPGDPRTELVQLTDERAFDRFAVGYADDWCAPWLHELREASGTPTAAFPVRRVLCAHRAGPFGTRRFNRLVERRLQRRRLIAADEEFYFGRPIIVTRNDPATGLANGDTGIVLQDADGARQVWFPDLARQDGERFLIAPSRLPEHESFFALTVHRAQGSEYDEVVFIPGPETSRVNTRELFYTAVTRARDKVVVAAGESGVRTIVSRVAQRSGGLLERLVDD